VQHVTCNQHGPTQMIDKLLGKFMGGARRKISLASIGIGALVSRPPTTMQVFSIAEGTIN